MRCATCSEELREGAKFCPTCGTPTAAGAAPVAQTMHIARNPGPPASTAARPEAMPQPPMPTSAASPAAAQLPSDLPMQDMPTAQSSYPPQAQAYGGPGRLSQAQGGQAQGGFAPQGTMAAGGAQAYNQPVPGYTPPAQSMAQPSQTYNPAAQQPPRPSGGAPGGLGNSIQVGAASSQDFARVGNRLLRLLKLDTSVFGEVYRDSAATIPAAALAAVILLISGIGGSLYISELVGFSVYEFSGSSFGGFFVKSVILGSVFALGMLVAWGFITQLLLKQVAGVQADALGLVRVFALALTPLALAILLIITDIASGLGWIVMGMVGALSVVAVLESEEVKPGHALIATLAGFAVFVIVLTFLGRGFRDLAPGFFAIG